MQWVEAEAHPGIDRVAAFVQGAPFEMHRHECYVIGITMAGVQHFTYRGRHWSAAAGQLFILPPDEAHEGYARAEEGFCYGAAHIDPALVQRAVGGKSLPCLNTPLVAPSPQQAASLAPLWQFDTGLEDGEIAEIVVALIDMSDIRADETRALPMAALARARAFIRVAPERPIALSELEHVSGLDRWSLARSFRRAFGVSPTRYRTMRQLSRVRALILAGESLAAAAVDAGFADQSHMSRKFRSAFGVTPGGWRAATTGPGTQSFYRSGQHGR